MESKFEMTIASLDVTHLAMDYSEYDVGGYQFQELKLVTCFRGDEYGVSSVSFDPQEDLLWAATYEGHVTSFYSSSLEKYTAFQAHHGDIRQLQPTMNGILSMTGKELRLTTRTGLPLFTLRDDTALNEMNCVLYLDETNLLAGCQTNQITSVDLTTAQVTGQTPTNAGICLLKLSEQYLCSGDITGQVCVLDPHSFQIVGSFQAHMAGMCDMDVVDNYLVTCGLTQQYGQLCVDCQLKIFDLRAMRPVSPCNVTMLQPFLVKSYPHLSSTILVLSQMGEFQFLDVRGLVTPSNMIVNQLSVSHEGTMACTVDVGPSASIAFGDSCGIVHLWSTQEEEELVLNPYAQPSVFPDQAEETPFISWDDDDPNSAPLSAVPMYLSPHTPNRGTFLSQWPASCSKFTRRIAPSIDPEVLGNMRMSQFVGHAPKPAHLRRNQVPYDLERDWSDSVPESPMMREINPLSLVPKPYRQVEIKYSKLGIETFDFGHYNDTKFAGLEIHIPNAYCNSMIQVLYFLEPVRCAMRNHLCSKEFCLACELGFLFQMLDQSDGRSCQASNFLRAFRTLREASALGLLLNWEDDGKKANLAKLIQSWNRFVLEQLNQETQAQPPSLSTGLTSLLTAQTGLTTQDQVTAVSQSSEVETTVEGESDVATDTSHVPTALPEAPPILPEEQVSIIQRLFGSEVETLIECRCGWKTTTNRTELLFSLFYQNNTEEVRGQRVGFVDVLRQSICRQQRLHAWCDNCAKFRPTTQQKSLCSLPFVLSINCQIESEADREFWQQTPPAATPLHQPTHGSPNSRWIPMSMQLGLKETSEGKSLEITESSSADEKESEEEGDGSGTGVSGDYELVMAVGHVKEAWMEVPGNLVAHIKVGPSYHRRKEDVAKTQWYLFNDFHITPLNEHEVGVFPTEWFTPCILVYAQRGFANHFDTKITSLLDRSVLLTETKGIRPVQSPATFTPLSLAETPQSGDLAAIDAEFVTLNQEEAEVKSDGTHTTLKPSQYSVARITVIRGKGPLEGTPFIDDYISTSEQVVDYLTKFSGINPGDLDATMSSKHLTTLKASYLKLIYLLEKGVKFVGHGLKKDFRVINIMVPSEQVLDTVQLFHLPNQRYISLKFLAWFYLGLHIQEGAHDSSEDARTALMLYRKYCELEAQAQTNLSLKKLYEAGRSCGWQVPDGR